MKPDPPIREDGRCALASCGRKRKPYKPPIAGMLVAPDPFCSTECCREWHHAPLSAGLVTTLYPEDAAA